MIKARSAFKTLFFFIITITLASLISGCGPGQKGSREYIQSIKEWHNNRVEGLKKENGWLNLAGLFWLNPGANTFGSAKGNDVVFPGNSTPAEIGTFYLNGGKVSVKINEGINVKSGDKDVNEIVMNPDVSGDPTTLSLGSLRWFIIKRGERYGVRLRNLQAPLVKNFEGIKTFPINEDWRLRALYTPYNPPRVISIPTVLGTVEQDTAFGKLVFKLQGKEFSLDPIKEGDEFFIIFADETNGEETYGAGRFVYSALPDSSGYTVIDFNKAYNPPCAFTKYATCPLPPKDNYLHIAVKAGEKKYGHGH